MTRPWSLEIERIVIDSAELGDADALRLKAMVEAETARRIERSARRAAPLEAARILVEAPAAGGDLRVLAGRIASGVVRALEGRA